MSRWWPEHIRIVLHPRQVAIVRMSKSHSKRILDKCIVPCSATNNGNPSWHNALQTLATELPGFCQRHGDATVVLSNHFVRYALVTNADKISNAEEERALIQYHFNRIYGTASAQWSLSMSRVAHPAWPRVACAVDQVLTDSLRALFPSSKPVLRSIQPYLMAAFNQYRHRLQGCAWLALVEDGILCLARLENKQWQSIKCSKIGHNWRQDLAIQLERQEFVSGNSPTQQIPVLLFAPEYPNPIDITPESKPEETADTHPVSILDPARWPEPIKTEEPAQAMALVG